MGVKNPEPPNFFHLSLDKRVGGEREALTRVHSAVLEQLTYYSGANQKLFLDKRATE